MEINSCVQLKYSFVFLNYFKMKKMLHKKKSYRPWQGGSVDWSTISYTKRLRVQFPVRAHT